MLTMIFPGSVILLAQFLTWLDPGTLAGFDKYFHDVDASIRAFAHGRTSLAAKPSGISSEAAGLAVGNGMLHDWAAVAVMPGVTKAQVIEVLEDFDHHPNYYPEVIRGKLESREPDRYVGIHRLRKKKVLETVLDVKYAVDIWKMPPNRYASRSMAVEIHEVDNPGKRSEKLLPEGKDHGYLWRMNTFWLLEDTPAGLWLECRSISLTRDTPPGMGWIIKPIIRDLPRESLTAFFEATKRAVMKQTGN